MQRFWWVWLVSTLTIVGWLLMICWRMIGLLLTFTRFIGEPPSWWQWALEICSLIISGRLLWLLFYKFSVVLCWHTIFLKLATLLANWGNLRILLRISWQSLREWSRGTAIWSKPFSISNKMMMMKVLASIVRSIWTRGWKKGFSPISENLTSIKAILNICRGISSWLSSHKISGNLTSGLQIKEFSPKYSSSES